MKPSPDFERAVEKVIDLVADRRDAVLVLETAARSLRFVDEFIEASLSEPKGESN